MDDVNLNDILSRYGSVFDKELETLKNVEVTMKIKSDARPKFCRARPIPHAFKDRIEKKLERIVTEGILELISHSDWAAPIFPIIKPNNSVRICGDYNQTLNKDPVMIKLQFQGLRAYLLHWPGVKSLPNLI